MIRQSKTIYHSDAAKRQQASKVDCAVGCASEEEGVSGGQACCEGSGFRRGGCTTENGCRVHPAKGLWSAAAGGG